MKFVRRVAIAVIAMAGLITCVVGAWFCTAVVDYAFGSAWTHFDALTVAMGLCGVAAVATGAGCAYLAARDLPRATLSRRATGWTWAATVAFSLVAFATGWFAAAGLPGPFITALFVRIAREPRGPGQTLHGILTES